ncbi:uncharacterized protein LOC106873180 isoform X2 [Octopus bimaculoides]|uniref:uncharacterized protein LOC106873180 isoform X2 n=1 Tax=Octopus bimaculoides TaxID=37653 RepID=UPI00071C5844|nr:uncharacterized protein LOC106873180 isoform X2 [Octopus bimaculoides]|eukprot:XP_014775899.1 PREDICTED: uncharacterized protein LOC106873180 isoform X2 [Octopus bimaculoides]
MWTMMDMKMLLVSCRCLNVQIRLKGDVLEEQYSDYPQEISSSKFECLPESALEAPISLSHSFFVQKKVVKEWTVYHCRNCDITTHAVSDQQTGDNRKFFIGKNMERDPTALECLRRSTTFSPAFQIILNTTVPFSGSMPAPQYFESLQNHLAALQTQMDNYLIEEESEMEERIRRYELQQKASFDKVQERAKDDKKKLITMLLSMMDVINAEEEAEIDKTENSCASGYQSSELPSTPSDIKNDFHSKSDSNSEKQMVSPLGDFELEADGMFYLSGEDQRDNQEPFYFSDDDDFALDSSTEVTEPSYIRGKKRIDPDAIHSASVPVNVPRFNQEMFCSSASDKENCPSPHDPQEIAASMKALAESLRKDEGFIFGDLPRPRLNTGDIAITRPTHF